MKRLATLAAGASLCASVALAGIAVPMARAGASSPSLVPVHGSLGSVPPGSALVGPTPTGKKLNLVVTLEPRDPSTLSSTVKAVSNPASPQYRHFLTPVQFAARYGATPATIERVVAFLKSQGLTVGPPSATGLSLPVSGTVGEVEAALSTNFSTYRLASGGTGYRANSPPRLPSNVVSTVEGILGLDTLSPPQPADRLALPSPPRARSGTPVPGPSASPEDTPALAANQPQPGQSCADQISSIEGGGEVDAVDLAQAYSFGSLYQSQDYGAGSTIALVELYGAGYLQSDIATFASCYGITNYQVDAHPMNGGGGTGAGTNESELDIETALSLAPQADIEVYEGGPNDSIYTVLNQIVADDTAKIVSISWTNGCEAYVGQSVQQSEATLLQASAAEGQSVFVASGDQGSEGCNLNRELGAQTGSNPVAQTVDSSSGTLYVANYGSDSVSVDSEDPADAPGHAGAASVPTAAGPEAVALDSAAKKIFVADAAANELTTVSTSSCNATATGGCRATTTISGAGGTLSTPRALAVDGSTLYVANGSGSVAVYNAATNSYVTRVSLPSGSTPSTLAVDPANGVVYVTDTAHARIEYFSATTCDATVTSGCGATPATLAIGTFPENMSLAVDDAAGTLYVGNAGSGGITVVSLSTHTIVTTIPTANIYGLGLVQSVGLSPSGRGVMAVLTDFQFPGDVLATIDPSSESIVSSVSLESGSDTVSSLVADGVRNDVWVIDNSDNNKPDDIDIVQNLDLAVTDPASQPGVTSVGGTSLLSIGPPRDETAWNDNMKYADGATGGGVSSTFAMPTYQQALLGSSGGGREVPDVSADADPSTGYIVYETSNGQGGWTAYGGTSAAAPLWAAVMAVVSSADGNLSGDGSLNEALYALASGTTNTYFNDITSGNNDYNASNAGQYPAGTGYDMATGLGTPIASALAAGFTRIPVDVAVAGTQSYGGTSSSFSATADYSGTGKAPPNVTLGTSGLTCQTVNGSTPINSSLPAGSDTLVPSSCSGATLSGGSAAHFVIVYTAAAGDFVVNPAPVNVGVSGSQTYGGSPTFGGTATNAPAGISLDPSGLVCREVFSTVPIAPTLAAGGYTIVPASCSGATLSGSGASNYTPAYTSVGGNFTVAPAPLTITASDQSMAFGTKPPTVTPTYQGFVNGDGPPQLTGIISCSAGATSSSPPGTYSSSCGGLSDPNYTIQWVDGTTTVNTGTFDVAVSGSQTYLGGPTFSGAYTAAAGVTVNTSGLSCADVSGGSGGDVTITGTLPVASYTLDPATCTGITLTGPNAGYYTLVPTSAAGDFMVDPVPVPITVSGQQTYGGAASLSGAVNRSNLPQDITVNTANLNCSDVSSSSPIAPTLPAGAYTVVGSSCSGATLSGTDSSDYAPEYVGASGGFTVAPAPLTATATTQTTQFGVVPAVGANFTGFVNGQQKSVLGGTLTCTSGTVATSPPGQYSSSCSGVSDPNYTITYVPGITTVTDASLDVTVSGSQTWDGSPSFSGSAAPLVGGTTLGTGGLTCSTVDEDVAITPTLAVGTHTLVAGSCSGATVSGPDAAYYRIAYSTYWADFVVRGGIHGYWLVGSDGGIFTFGSAQFYGSTGSLTLQRPVVGITPTENRSGYWLVASDGGVFAFGDAGFYGSIPGLGLHPAGSGLPNSLNAPIVGIVPTVDGGGYFMVASDGGVFAFGDARFEGSCPGSGGCSGPVVAVVPDATGNGYWVVTQTGNVYTFGDAPYLGAPGPDGAPVTSAVRTWNGRGYWILRADGTVDAYGNAVGRGGPTGDVGGLDPATAIFTDSDSGGYWVADAAGGVFAYGDAPADGSMAGTRLNGAIIAGSGF